MNQDFFDKVLGKDAVKSFEEFEEKIKASIALNYEQLSMSKFRTDAYEYLLDKISPRLPEEILRKWLSDNNDIDESKFENEFQMFLRNTKLELIGKAIANEHKLKVEEQEIINFAASSCRKQISMYGHKFSDKEFSDYVSSMLKDENYVREMASELFAIKIAQVIFETVDVNLKEISLDEFNKIGVSQSPIINNQ